MRLNNTEGYGIIRSGRDDDLGLLDPVPDDSGVMCHVHLPPGARIKIE